LLDSLLQEIYKMENDSHPPSPIQNDPLGNVRPVNWGRSKAVGAACVKLEPEVLEVLPILCQGGPQAKASVLPYAINVVSRTAERIQRGNAVARERVFERRSMYNLGKAVGRREEQERKRDEDAMEDDVETANLDDAMMSKRILK
jgi:hypothetical protein